MPLFFRISGALLLAAFLYLGISLQFVDAGEACSSERLAADRIYLPWYSMGALLLFAGVELRGGISAQLWARHTHSAHQQPYPQQREVCHLDFPHHQATPFWLRSAREPAGSIILPHCNPNVTISSVAQRGGMPDAAKTGHDLQECFYQESGKRDSATLGLSERWVSVYCLQMKHLCQYLSRSGRLLCYPAMVAAAYAGHLFLLAMLNRAMNLEARLPVHPAGWLCRQLMPGITICGETGYNVLMLDALICETLALLPLWYFLCPRRVFCGFLVLWGLSLAALLFTVHI